jgi:hypothetical protein
MFFGPLLNNNRVYADLFHDLKTISSVRSTCWWMCTEVVGDPIAAYALSNAYLMAENELLHKVIDNQRLRQRDRYLFY